MVSGETAIEASNPEEVTGSHNPWRYLKVNFSPATPPPYTCSYVARKEKEGGIRLDKGGILFRLTLPLVTPP